MKIGVVCINMKIYVLFLGFLLSFLILKTSSSLEISSQRRKVSVISDRDAPLKLDQLTKQDITEELDGIIKKESREDDDQNRAEKVTPPAPRTATGGIINTLMIFLTFMAFIGNAAFLVHVFWLKERIDHTLAPPKSILPFNNFGMG